jgi:hypothetical protein
MRAWLQETHAPTFELLRHFLRRFFDSDLVTSPGQITGVLVAAVPFLFEWFLLLFYPLAHKYGGLSGLPTPGPYRESVRADELWLITLTMSAIGLLTAIKWQSLFPDLRDYRALAGLPLRPVQIFGAKLTALLLVTTAALVTINLLPSFALPAVSSSHWALQQSLGARVMAHAMASVAASSFFFFGLLALQGLLLNILRPRAFGRVTGSLQGALVAVMLALIVMSFSIQPQITSMMLRPDWAEWLPPVWFLGLYQSLSGDTDPMMRVLANRAEIALASAVALAFLSYLISYQRHRTLMVEGIEGKTARARRFSSLIPGWISRHPRQQAILAFMLQTLGRSNRHRMILMGYAGLGFAIVLTGIAVLHDAAADFVCYHIVVLLFLLIGARYLFSLPTELKANRIFQITEGEGRTDWLRAVDRFVFLWGGALLLLIPFPVEVRLLGLRGIAEATLFGVLGLVAFECAFSPSLGSGDKLPFTCSHLPSKMPIWMILAFIGLFGVLSMLHTLLLAALYNAALFAALISLLLVAWWRIRSARRQSWAELRLKYEEAPAPAVYGLNLLK